MTTQQQKNIKNKVRNIIVAYHRVSSAEQANGGLSLNMQKEETDKWAKRRNYEIIHFEDAGKTGTNMKRAGLQSMLQYIKTNKTRCVLVWKLDRLSRNQEDFFGKIKPTILKYGSTIASITENFEDIRKVKKVLLGVYLGQAEDEVDNTKERTQSVMKNRSAKGYKLGKAPLGYKNERDIHNHGIIVPDPSKAHYIKRAFELYATGQFSYKRVGEELFKQGLSDKHNKPYPPRMFERILHNPVYVGKVTWGNEIFEGLHKPLVTKELFHRVQMMFKETRKAKSNNEQFVYTNYIKCKQCGYAMIAYLKHGAHNSGNYIYYHCSNYSGAHSKQKNIRQELIDEAMQEILESFDISDNELKTIKKEILSAVKELQSYEYKSLQELTKQYNKITNIISNSIKQKISGELNLDETTFNELQRKWLAEKDELAIKISELSSNTKETLTRMNILADFANRMPELYLKAKPQEKRLIVATITDSIEYDQDKMTLYVKLKPIFEYLRQLKCQKKQKFFANKKTLDRTLKTRLNNAKKTYKNLPEGITLIKEYRTLETLTNTKKEPHIETQFDITGGNGN